MTTIILIIFGLVFIFFGFLWEGSKTPINKRVVRINPCPGVVYYMCQYLDPIDKTWKTYGGCWGNLVFSNKHDSFAFIRKTKKQEDNILDEIIDL